MSKLHLGLFVEVNIHICTDSDASFTYVLHKILLVIEVAEGR